MQKKLIPILLVAAIAALFMLYHIEMRKNGMYKVYVPLSKEIYFTKDYHMNGPNCIAFKDIQGLSRVICGNYSITKY